MLGKGKGLKVGVAGETRSRLLTLPKGEGSNTP